MIDFYYDKGDILYDVINFKQYFNGGDVRQLKRRHVGDECKRFAKKPCAVKEEILFSNENDENLKPVSEDLSLMNEEISMAG